MDDLGSFDTSSVEKCAVGAVIIDYKILRHLSKYIEVNLFNFRVCDNNIRLRRDCFQNFSHAMLDILRI